MSNSSFGGPPFGPPNIVPALGPLVGVLPTQTTGGVQPVIAQPPSPPPQLGENEPLNNESQGPVPAFIPPTTFQTSSGS
jgi:hypothetical protein